MLEMYDQRALNEIARHIVEPGRLVRVAGFFARPIESALITARSAKNPVIKKIQEVATGAVHNGVKKIVQTAGAFTNDRVILQQYQQNNIYLASLNDIKNLRLQYIDQVASSYGRNNATLVGLEGALMGAATAIAEGTFVGMIAVPTLVAADVSLSLALLSRSVCQIAATYGYSPQNPLNLPHLLAALVPHQSLSDESYFASKGLAVQAVIQSKQFLLNNAGHVLEERLLKQQAPQLLRLLTYVLQRLGLFITEKELLLLLPAAGALLNSGTNLVFQQLGQRTAKDYFRLLFLEEQYGREMIQDLLTREIENLRQQ